VGERIVASVVAWLAVRGVRGTLVRDDVKRDWRRGVSVGLDCYRVEGRTWERDWREACFPSRDRQLSFADVGSYGPAES